MYKTHAMNNVNAKNSRILSVHSRLPYLLSSFLECNIELAVLCNSSLVPSTVFDEETNVSNVAALFCVVSDKWRVIANIFSVTLSCWNTKLDWLCLEEPRCLNSFPSALDKSSCLSNFSISSIVLMFALRNACNVLKEKWRFRWVDWRLPTGSEPHLENCCRWESISAVSSASFRSAA